MMIQDSAYGAGRSSSRRGIAASLAMTSTRFTIFTVLTCILGAVPLFAVTAPAIDAQGIAHCADDSGVNRCDADQRQRMFERYSLPSLALAMGDNQTIIRIFYIDGYGRDLVAITFVRDGNGTDRTSIAYPSDGAGALNEALNAPFPAAAWSDLRQRAEPLFANPETSERKASEPPSICLHGWMFDLESADRARSDNSVHARKRIVHACDDQMVPRFALDAAAVALEQFPACAALDPAQYRHAPSRLSACRLLNGNQLEAASVMNRGSKFRMIKDGADAVKLADMFTSDANILWNGRSSANENAASFWARHAGGPRGWTNLNVKSITGVEKGEVTLTGMLSRSIDTDRGAATGSETADVEQIWIRGQDGKFRVRHAEVSGWKAR